MDRTRRLQAHGVMHKHLLSLLAFASLLVFGSNAVAAEEDRPVGAPAAAKTRDVSLTLDPTRPLIGMGMVNGEVRFPRMTLLPNHRPMDVSLGGWVGAGRVRVADDGLLGGARPVWSDCGDMFNCDRMTAIWVGAQALAYPVGGFDHGLQIGVEASFMQTWGSRRYSPFYKELAASMAKVHDKPFTGVPDRDVEGSAFLPGVVVGYKLVTQVGFTFNPQVAADLFVSNAPVKVVPRLALNAGWSF
jgi:hypothetical protein